MTIPGIEIRWGSYNNDRYGSYKITDTEQRKVLRPKLQQALEMVIRAMPDYSLEINNKKYLDVYRVKPFYFYTAATSTSKTMQLFLRPHQLYGRLDVGRVSQTLFHEYVHAARMEKIAPKSLGELAATEGIAYVADYFYGKNTKCWSYNRTPIVEQVMEWPRLAIETQRRNLSKLQHEKAFDPQGNHWLRVGSARQLSGLCGAEVIGINAVYRQVEAGRAIGELLHLPASEILGLEETI